MSLIISPALRCALVIWSRVTPHRFIQYSTALRSERSSRSLSMKPRLSFNPANAFDPRSVPKRSHAAAASDLRAHTSHAPAMRDHLQLAQLRSGAFFTLRMRKLLLRFLSAPVVRRRSTRPVAAALGRRGFVRGRSARTGPGHRRPRCRGSGRCSPASCGRAGADRRAGTRAFVNQCHLRATQAMGAVGGIKAGKGDLVVDQPAVLPRRDMIADVAPAREQPVPRAQPALLQPRRERFAGGVGQLEGNRSAGLLLDNGRAQTARYRPGGCRRHEA